MTTPSPKAPRVKVSTPPKSVEMVSTNSFSFVTKNLVDTVRDKIQGKKHYPRIVLKDGSSPDFHGRVVTLHNHTKNTQQGFPTNYVSTTHYTWYNFLPKNLIQQFGRVANVYFLACAVFTLLPLSPYEPYTSIGPLVFVLGVSAIREALEDFSRHKQDRATNNRRARVLRDGQFVSVSWAEIVVGDVVRVDIDTMIPADLVLLASSDESGLCYVETANLDGETNLKAKASLANTQHCLKEADIMNLDAEILAEHPSTDLYKFQGQLILPTQSFAILPSNILLRGCELRNTSFAIGIVIYTGNETRIQMNAARPASKRSRIEVAMNTEIYRILGLQCILCFISALCFGLIKDNDQDGQWYGAHRMDVGSEASETFVTWVLLLSVMLPISLYVTLEIVKVLQGLHIGWDLGMYYEPLDKPCEVRSVSLNEDLGQISYVFSDKTGTLTRNEMVFKKGSVVGKIFEHFDHHNDVVEHLYETLTSTDDEREQEAIHMFLLNLSLCHTVIPEAIPGTTDFKYLSPSPDEEALVVAAAANHYVLTQRTATTLTIRVPPIALSVGSSNPTNSTDHFNPATSQGKEQTYTILRVLEFTSDRKRMTVILRCPDNRLLLLSKGADTEIMRRLDKSMAPELISATKQNLVAFASDGLRTLVLGYRWLDENWFAEWNERYETASLSPTDRDQLVEEVSDSGEQNLSLCGATAIEDRLQDGVPDTLMRLRIAGVRVWVLTGDKQETAINIGHSSGLLLSGMHIFVLNGLGEEELQQNDDDAAADGHVESEIEKKARRDKQGKEHATACFKNALDFINSKSTTQEVARGGQRRGSHGLGFALVLDSETLKWALDEKFQPDLRPQLLELAEICRSVLLCRCTPLQKAQAVNLVKVYGTTPQGVPPVTLAIGDGANDVGMIQAAHIGVGISGKEGMQAVQASDYAFAQFAFLQRLMFLHGRWNYRRISILVIYSFYKNIALVITQFWFGFQSQFTGQTLYDGLAGNIYNVFFTSGILVTAVLDKDASEKVLIENPELYRSGMLNERFTSRIFWSWWIEGLWDSAIIYLVCVKAVEALIVDPDGQDMGLDAYGFVVYSAAVLVVNFRLALANNYWTWINWLFFWGSIALWYLFGMLYATEAAFVFTTAVYWVFFNAMEVPAFWFLPLLAGVACNIPIFVKMALQRELKKSWKQQLKEAEKFGIPIKGHEPVHQRVSLHERAQHRGLKAKQPSVIIDVGHKNRVTSHSGFAMEKSLIKKPFVRAKRAATKRARAFSRRLSHSMGNKSHKPEFHETVANFETTDLSNPPPPPPHSFL